jgi:hypothetical protein
MGLKSPSSSESGWIGGLALLEVVEGMTVGLVAFARVEEVGGEVEADGELERRSTRFFGKMPSLAERSVQSLD